MALQAKRLEKLLRQEGMGVQFLPSNFALPGWADPLGRVPGLRTILRAMLIWPKLWRQVRGVEIVHVLAASWLYFFLVVCPAICVGRIRGKRVVLNYRGGAAGKFFDRFGWAVAPFVRAASVVTAPSEFLAHLIHRRFRIPVTIVPNILDLSLFRFRQRTKTEPKLLVARHLENIYDIESVLRAFQAIQEHHPDASLRIAGTGSQEAYLRALAATWKLNHVRFLGSVAHEDLPAVYDQCDIFINASRVDNFPGALLEASAAGLPLVSTCAGGIPFIYEHGKSALFVEPGDWRGLAAAVEKLLESPSLAIKLSAEGAAVARKCDWAAVRSSLYHGYGVSSEPVGAAVRE
jgi:glycosyltransferase involved in cell wall biosynthesis